jgi:hypothetical protein
MENHSLPNRSSLDTSTLTRQAYDSAENNRWIEAARICRQAIGATNPAREISAIRSLTELSAKCHFKGAFQARSREEFVELMTASRKAWDNARILYDDAQQFTRSKKAQLGAELAEFWLRRDSAERTIIAQSVLRLYRESARAFENSGEEVEAIETQVGLLGFYRDSINLHTDFRTLKEAFDQAVNIGISVLDELKKSKVANYLVGALASMVWLLGMEAEAVMPPSEFQSLSDQTRNYLAELHKLSQQLATPSALCLAGESAGHVAFDITGDASKALEQYEESLAIATTLGDSLAIGKLQWLSSQAAYWLGYTENDPEKKRRLFMKGESHALNAIQNLEIPFQTSELSAACAARGTCLIELANLTGSDVQKKRSLLAEAVDASSKATRYESGTWAWSHAAHSLARALYFLSKLEKPEQRILLLREALSAREKIMEVTNRISPHFWTNVVAAYNLALVRSEIATLENNPVNKRALLQKASQEMEICLDRGEKWGTNSGFIQRLAEHSEAYGDILSQLHAATGDPDLQHHAIKSYETAITRFTSSKITANIPRLRSKIAKTYDSLGAFEQSSQEFKTAAEESRRSVAEVPGTASFFDDLGRYLDAWSLIEAARLQHEEGNYVSASKYYAATAQSLAETRTWPHLSNVFAAHSLLEKGEGRSSEEKHDRAIESFKAATDKFQEEQDLLEEKLRGTTNPGERSELDDWLKISHQRASYCRGRLELEQARDFDKKGEKQASARKFHESSNIFAVLLEKTSDTQERVELEGLAKLCDSWALMKEAEARASPELYFEAARAFLELRSTQTKGQLPQLALANAAICKALGAGTQYRQTQDVQYYTEVKKQTESAAEHFRLAGFRKTEAWTRATQRLFDALIFISDAEIERDPSRKTTLYHMAENHLELAARLYGEAGFPTKKAEALTDLDRIKEEKQVLLAPLEVLSQIPMATPTPVALTPRGRGQPAGIQRLEEAYVVGDLNVPRKELLIGEEMVLDLEIANVGKASATLVKLQGVLPEGFELRSDSEVEISPEGQIDMKGRRLEHLKTHQVKISVAATRKGTTELRPRLFYADDAGNYKTFQFQPTSLTVLDVGVPEKPISLALHAISSTVDLLEGFRFDTERARGVFHHLVREFLVDYMSKRLYVDRAGWRTLVQIVRETKIPRSALYGPRGRDGPVLAELERRGLVESRIFPKERGRGGAVKRVRVAYENAIVKKIVEQSVIENK